MYTIHMPQYIFSVYKLNFEAPMSGVWLVYYY